MPRYTPLVESLPSTVPFIGPETQERARKKPFIARVGANESVFGPSPKAIKAMADAAQDVWKYADPENHDLKQALADHLGVSTKNIIIGEGIDGLLGLLVRILVEQDTPVVTSYGTYPTFNFHVAGVGGKLVEIPFKDNFEDIEGLLAAQREHNAPLVYLSNPDNPMGTFHTASAVQDMISALPDDGLLCLDEAYCEFAPAEALLPIDVSEPRVIRMRTFSKAYGMAGARIGYAVGHEGLIRAFEKIRNHYGVNLVGLAGALAALEDQEWLQSVVQRVHAANSRIADIARENGLTPLPTSTNFVTIDCGSDADFSGRVIDALTDRDVFVRRPFVVPENRCIRISAGTDNDIDHVAKMLPEALKAARTAS